MYKASERRGSKGPQRAKCSQIFRMHDTPGGQGGPRKAAAASVSVAIHKSTWMARSLFSQLDDFSLVHRLEAWKRRKRMYKASERRGSKGPQRAKCSQIFRMHDTPTMFRTSRGLGPKKIRHVKAQKCSRKRRQLKHGGALTLCQVGQQELPRHVLQVVLEGAPLLPSAAPLNPPNVLS